MKTLTKISLVLTLLLAITFTLPAQEIFDAVQKGDLAKVKELIDNDSKLLAAKDNRKFTPLQSAVFFKKKEIVKYLLEKGAPVNLKEFSRSPLWIAAWVSDIEMAKLLIEKGADINYKNEMYSVLEVAATTGKSEIVDYLLEKGVLIPSLKEVNGKKLLSSAINRGLVKLYNALVPAEADLMVKDGAGNNFLHKASAGGSVEIINKLVNDRLNINDANSYGWTPLHFAADKGHKEAAALLLEKGARINNRTIDGNTAYNLAVDNDRKEVIKLLTSKGSDLSVPQIAELTGEYFGQKNPGKTPEIFAFNFVASRYSFHSTPTFTPDGKEAYWTVMDFANEGTGATLESKIVNGRWIRPQLASIPKALSGVDVPFISPDGKKLFFISDRPIKEGDKLVKENIWVTDRVGNGWSEPKPLPPVVNSIKGIHWQFSVDNQGNLYFAAIEESGIGDRDIYCSKYINDEYLKPENLGPVINTPGTDMMPFISPDGSYLLFSRTGVGTYICFSKKDRTWTQPRNISSFIKTEWVLCPIVTGDGKYLFYLDTFGSENKPYWVDASFIEDLRKEELKDDN